MPADGYTPYAAVVPPPEPPDNQGGIGLTPEGYADGVSAPAPIGLTPEGYADGVSAPAAPQAPPPIGLTPEGYADGVSAPAPQAPPPIGFTPEGYAVGSSAPPQKTGLISGLLEGAGAATTEGAQTLTGNAFADDPNAAPPADRSWFNELGYGFGHSYPTAAAGVAAGVGGLAVGGPIGGIVAGAGAMGLAALAQELRPAYLQATQQGLSHDDAVRAAVEQGVATGAVTGATAPLFAYAPFESMLGKALFTSFVTAPAAGAAARVAVPALTGQPEPSMGQLVSGYGQDALGALAFAAGHGAYHAVRGEAPPPLPAYGSEPDVAVRAALTPTGAPSATERVMAPETAPAVEPPPAPPPAPPEPPPAVPPVAEPPAPVAEPERSAPPPAPPDQAEPTTTVSTAAPAAVPSVSETPAPAPGAAAETRGVPPDTSPPPPATPPEVPPPSRPEIAAPLMPSAEPVTPPPDDGSDTTARGPGPAETLGAEHPQGVQPAGEPAQAVGGPDTRGLPPDTQAPGQAPGAETAGVAPSTYTVDNPHPASIGARIDQLEQLGASRTPEQTAQLQALHQQREAAAQASPELAAKQDQLSQLNNQITTLEAQEQKASARKNNAIQPSKALIAQRDQLDALKQQRGALQSDITAAQPIERQRYNQAVYGEPKLPVERAKAAAAAEPAHRPLAEISAEHTQANRQLTTLKGQITRAQNAGKEPAPELIARHAAAVDQIAALEKEKSQALYAQSQAERAKAAGAPALADRTPTRDTMPEGVTPGLRDANETGPAIDQALTTEPDHEVPGQHVAKNAAGQVVGLGDTPEQALDMARQRQAARENPVAIPTDGAPIGTDETGTRSDTGPASTQTVPKLRSDETGTSPADEAAGPAGPEPVKDLTETQQPALDPNSQLGKLTTTRDALLEATPPGKTRSGQQEGRIQRLNDQIAKQRKAQNLPPETPGLLAARRGAQKFVPKPGEAKTGGPRVAGIKQPYLGPPRVGQDPVMDKYRFNNGTSVYRSVFAQAGHDPDVMINRPIKEQNDILRQHMQDVFGFKEVRQSADTTPVDAKNNRDAMLDATRAIQDMMASLNQPHKNASLDGRLSLTFEPEGKRNYAGAYDPRTNEILLTGSANSFGHEWIHARDHFLAERLLNHPQRANLLSRYAKQGVLDPKDGIMGAFAKVMNSIFYDKSAQALRELALSREAAQTDKTGAPTKAALEAQRQIDLLARAGSKLAITPSEFRAAALRSADPRYLADPAELLARSGEAFIARKMENNGANPRGAVKPEAAYIAETNKMFADLYPQEQDQMTIFKAMDDLEDEIRKANILGAGQPPGAFPDLGISDPRHYKVTVPGQENSPMAQAIKAENRRWANLTKQTITGQILDKSRPAGPLTWQQKRMDNVRSLGASDGALMRVIIKRSPAAAQPFLQRIADRFGGEPGSGRYVGEPLQQAAQKRENDYGNALYNIMRKAGYRSLDDLPDEDDAMIRHAMTSSEPYQAPDGTIKQIPGKMITAAAELRQQHDVVYQDLRDVGIDIGYADRHFPRNYDQAAAFDDPTGFHRQAAKAYRIRFDNDVGTPGDDPQALLEKWTTLSATDKDLARATDPTMPDDMRALGANLKRQREIEIKLTDPIAGTSPSALRAELAQLQRVTTTSSAVEDRQRAIEAELANPTNPAALRAELAQLKADAAQQASNTHDALGDHVAKLEAGQWYDRLVKSTIHHFDTQGPSGRFLNTRTMPPETDVLMRDFMHTRIADALPHYYASAARRIADAERFGAQSEGLDALVDAALKGGVHPDEMGRFLESVDRQRGTNPGGSRQGRAATELNAWAHAYSSLVMMPRSVWSQIAEPMNASLATGQFSAGPNTYGYQWAHIVGTIFKTASAAERTRWAQAVGIINAGHEDAIMASRMGANYDSDPKLGGFTARFFRMTGMTLATNSMRIGNAQANHWVLRNFAKDFLAPDTGAGSRRAQDNATRWFNDMGIPPEVHNKFATWLKDTPGMPSADDILADKDGMMGAYNLGVRHLVDRSIQDPKKIDRAARSLDASYRLVFQLQSFNYSMQHNILNPAMERVGHAYTFTKKDAIAHGASPAAATAKALAVSGGTAVKTVALAGSIVGATFMASTLRQLLFAPDQWEEHKKNGDLWSWLRDLAMQRSGLNGVFDPIIQTLTNARYLGDTQTLLNGAGPTWVAKNVQDILTGVAGANDSPNTNTAAFNAIKASFNLVGVPLATYGLTLLSAPLAAAGGIPGEIGASLLSQFATSPYAVSKVTAAIVGRKGATRADTGGSGDGLPELPEPPELPSLPGEGGVDEGGGGGGAKGAASGVGAAPWGMADDVAVPLIKIGGPWVSALPGPLKIAGAGLAAAYGAKELWDYGKAFRGQPAPGN